MIHISPHANMLQVKIAQGHFKKWVGRRIILLERMNMCQVIIKKECKDADGQDGQFVH